MFEKLKELFDCLKSRIRDPSIPVVVVVVLVALCVVWLLAGLFVHMLYDGGVPEAEETVIEKTPFSTTVEALGVNLDDCLTLVSKERLSIFCELPK